jgi:hypothetical protein
MIITGTILRMTPSHFAVLVIGQQEIEERISGIVARGAQRTKPAFLS